MKPRERERERERGREDDVISDDGGCSTPPPPPPPPALRPPTDVICKVFSQLDCVDLLSCSLVCKQWYRDSSELREGWKSEYKEASALFCLGIKRDVHPPSSTCSIRGLHCWCP
ncbi:uncharacterized protein LOC144549226 isoform X2 [Carex rostrata]